MFDLSLSIITLIQPVVVNKRAGRRQGEEAVGVVMFTMLLSSASRVLLNPFQFCFLQVHADREALFAEQMGSSGVYRSSFSQGDL